MARNDPQVNLRMPENLKALLDAAAEKNKRTLTAEVVSRLERTFVDDLMGATDEGPIFNIVLDAKGRPIGWPEIAAHIHRTAKAAGLESVGFKAAIFNAAPAEDDPFAKEYMRLIRWYQEQTRLHKDRIRSNEPSA
ncbi:MAG: Arc family DNA-binding protein [Mesorhizobium sp.]|nr:MAG: Arc family DNA-binding protein [Mesorhizobium sp.]